MADNSGLTINPAPIRLQAVEVIRQAITSGRFEPGQRLSDKLLCDLLGISRSSVREALRQLETDGLIVNEPYRGPSVARPSVEDVRNIYEVRGALEALAAKDFAERASDEELAALHRSIDELALAYETRDVDHILEVKRGFYAILLQGARNGVITSTLRSLNDRITLMRRVTLSSPVRLNESLAELREILAALAARDAEEAHARTLRHINAAMHVAVELYRASQAPPKESPK